jgi:hypothetical protein
MTVDAIKDAIQHLPEQERWKLAAWFEEMEETAWDGEMQRDFAPGGRGEQPSNQVQREISEGKARTLEEGLGKRHRPRPSFSCSQ